MIREEIWWPDELVATDHVIEGTNIHERMGERQGPDEHLYTMKQTREEIIWACACGRTLSRYKP